MTDITVIVEPPAPIEVVVEVAGPPGPRGVAGPSGEASGATFTAKAGAVLSGQRVVRPQADGSVVYADPTTLSDVSGPFWLTLEAATTIGQDVSVQAFGEIIDTDWAWTPEQPVFLGAAGALTQTVPTAGAGDSFLVLIGVAFKPTGLFVNPRSPIVLI